MAITEIATNRELEQYLKSLETEGIDTIAMDLEGEFNLHCYGEHLCLVQIFDGKREIIIDPVAHPNLSMLDTLFSKRSLMKIMYDSSSDASLVQHVRGVRIMTILDLKPAVSLLEYTSQGLSSVLETEFGIRVPNKKKFQRFNWMRRPIAPDAVEYAMNDVRMLFTLKERLFEKLQRRKLMDSYILRNLYIQNGEITPLDKDRYRKAKGFSRLPSDGKQHFRQLFSIRDRWARRANLPPNTIFSNRDLLDTAAGRVSGDDIAARITTKKLTSEERRKLAGELAAVLRKRR